MNTKSLNQDFSLEKSDLPTKICLALLLMSRFRKISKIHHWFNFQTGKLLQEIHSADLNSGGNALGIADYEHSQRPEMLM